MYSFSISFEEFQEKESGQSNPRVDVALQKNGEPTPTKKRPQTDSLVYPA